jgi:hypothetical protein
MIDQYQKKPDGENHREHNEPTNNNQPKYMFTSELRLLDRPLLTIN